MARLRFKDIKIGDKFKANCTGNTWTVYKKRAKTKKIVAYTLAPVGCVEMEFGIGQINNEFVKVNQ